MAQFWAIENPYPTLTIEADQYGGRNITHYPVRW
jgi:hypothetical protein